MNRHHREIRDPHVMYWFFLAVFFLAMTGSLITLSERGTAATTAGQWCFLGCSCLGFLALMVYYFSNQQMVDRPRAAQPAAPEHATVEATANLAAELEQQIEAMRSDHRLAMAEITRTMRELATATIDNRNATAQARRDIDELSARMGIPPLPASSDDISNAGRNTQL